MSVNPSSPTTPPTISPRFTLELEFVLCLANPFYLQYLAGTFPHLLNPTLPSKTSKPKDAEDNSDAAKFARYLSYLYDYWRTPEYSQYLTHPGAVLRNLQLLQQESFRRDLIRPDVIAKLFETNNEMKNGTVSGGVEGTGDVLGTQPVDDQLAAGEQMDVTNG